MLLFDIREYLNEKLKGSTIAGYFQPVSNVVIQDQIMDAMALALPNAQAHHGFIEHDDAYMEQHDAVQARLRERLTIVRPDTKATITSIVLMGYIENYAAEIANDPARSNQAAVEIKNYQEARGR